MTGVAVGDGVDLGDANSRGPGDRATDRIEHLHARGDEPVLQGAEEAPGGALQGRVEPLDDAADLVIPENVETADVEPEPQEAGTRVDDPVDSGPAPLQPAPEAGEAVSEQAQTDPVERPGELVEAKQSADLDAGGLAVQVAGGEDRGHESDNGNAVEGRDEPEAVAPAVIDDARYDELEAAGIIVDGAFVSQEHIDTIEQDDRAVRYPALPAPKVEMEDA